MNETDHIHSQLCARIEELEKEKLHLNTLLDNAQQDLESAKRAKDILRETFISEIQKAVKRARRDWASHTSDEIKALWMAVDGCGSADSRRLHQIRL